MNAERFSRQPSSTSISRTRQRLSLLVIYGLMVAVSARLFYWQVLQRTHLQAAATAQYQQVTRTQGLRGSVYTADGYPLVTNNQVYRLFVEPPLLQLTPPVLVNQVLPTLLAEVKDYTAATESTKKAEIEAALEVSLLNRLQRPDAKWVGLFQPLSESGKQTISALALGGVGFEPYFQRSYPEASMAAHLTGFVGRTEQGEELGYFGVEGALENELRGRQEQSVSQRDAFGRRLWGMVDTDDSPKDGRDVVLTIRRDIQNVAETVLKAGIERYGAKSGEVIIMEPATGKILAMADFPQYDQRDFSRFPAELYKNPSVSAGFEPGSTFKTLTVAAGIDAGVITPETECPQCAGPRQIGKYQLKTWNNEYTPNITMKDAIAKSDNTAMIYVAQQLGPEKFQEYLDRFQIGQKSGVELQEDTSPPFPSKWGAVELATISFGQGVSTTSLQMVKSIGAIANQGLLMRPTIVEKVIDRSNQEELVVEPHEEGRVISVQTAEAVTQMMVYAAENGEAKWTTSRNHQVAAKTGTSQIAENGQYLADKTIASFVGFSPPDNPRFIMMVKLVEPSTSPWAAETAAPLWYQIADRLFLLLQIPADK